MKQKVQLFFGIIALVGLLVYTFIHTGGLLASYIRPGWAGYVAAFGIECSVVALSIRIGDLRRLNRSAAFFLFTLVGVVLVSGMANVAEGFRVKQGVELTVATARAMDPAQAVFGFSATGLMSLLVMALSEVLSGDVSRLIARAEREERKRERMEEVLSAQGGAQERAQAGSSGAQAGPERAEAGLNGAGANSSGAEARFVCEWCGYEGRSKNALSGHQAHCAAKKAAQSAIGRPQEASTSSNGREPEAEAEAVDGNGRGEVGNE